jgi:hypothetical protein
MEKLLSGIWDFFNLKNKTRTKQKFFIIRSKRFHTPRLRIKQNGTLYNRFYLFFTSLERLYLFQASPVSKLNFSIKTKKYQNENKTFAVSLKFVVSKQNNTFDTTI